MSVWEELWDRINPSMSSLADELLACNPAMWWTAEHHETPTFPFGAFASFSADGTPGEADVVLSFSVKRTSDQLEVISDITTGEGLILAQSRRAVLKAEQSGAVLLDDLLECLTDLDVLLRQNLDEIRRLICSNSPDITEFGRSGNEGS